MQSHACQPALAVPFAKAEVIDYVENGTVPEPFLDIITHDLMRSPARVVKTGQIYDRASLAAWSHCCRAKNKAVQDPNTNTDVGRRVKLARVPALEASLVAFREAVNSELAARGEPLLEESAPVRDSLSRWVTFSALFGCFGV